MANAAAVEKKMAADYGYALAFLQSVPEVYALFQQAVKGTWTADKFVAALKNTKWYKTQGSTARTNQALKKSDPATYASNLAQQTALVRDRAAAVGAVLTNDQLRQIAEHSLDLGWNDAQLTDTLSRYINISHARGDAGSNLAAMKQSAYRNGIKVGDATYQQWTRNIASGEATVNDFQAWARRQAASLAPGYADEINSGMDLYDVAQPYMQTMASTLELNPADVDLFNPTVRKALSGVNKDGKPATTSLWQFEQQVRQDPRWLKTQAAQDQTFSVAHKVLQDFGLTGA